MSESSRLRFVTNGKDFDFPDYVGEPSHPYLIASTPRCGSNFLQRALWRTGRAGAPEEYLTPEYVSDFNLRLGTDFDSPLPVEQMPEFVKALWRIRTTPNGAFGMKLHGSHLRFAIDDTGQLLPPFRRSKWIWIRRLNRIAQAVSYLIADQTGIWIVDGTWLPRTESNAEPEFDYAGIAIRLQQIKREEAQWEEFFGSSVVQSPLVVEYERLVSDYEGSIRHALEFLGVEAPRTIEGAGIHQQASDLNAEWEARFRALTAEEG